MSEITSLPLDPIPSNAPTQSTVHRAWVRPDKPAAFNTLELSCIDQIAPRVYNMGVMPFRLRADVDKAEVFRDLAYGLRQALNETPEWSGKVVPVSSPRDGFGLEMDDQGVLLQMLDATLPENAAVWPFGTFDDLARIHFSVSAFPGEVFCQIENDSKSIRALAAQVTFVEGGMILCASYHHIVGDGPAANAFYYSWAKHTASAARSEIIPMTKKPEDVHKRSPIDTVGIPSVKLSEFPGWKLANETSSVDHPRINRSIGLTGTGPISPHDMEAQRPVISTWHISHEKLKALRHAIGGDRGRIGTNEALCALIWRHVSLARGLNESEFTSSVLSTTCDCRKTMGLHPLYSGNMCEPNAYSRLSLRDVCASGDASLYKLASTVRNAIQQVDNKAVRRLVGLLKQMPSATHLTWNCNRWPGPDMLISSLLEAGWTDLDWGMTLGSPEVGRFLVGPDSPVDGRIFLLPRAKNSKGVEVMIRYPQSVLDRLASDPEWTRYMDLWYY